MTLRSGGLGEEGGAGSGLSSSATGEAAGSESSTTMTSASCLATVISTSLDMVCALREVFGGVGEFFGRGEGG